VAIHKFGRHIFCDKNPLSLGMLLFFFDFYSLLDFFLMVIFNKISFRNFIHLVCFSIICVLFFKMQYLQLKILPRLFRVYSSVTTFTKRAEVHHTHSSKILNLVTDDLAKRICFQDFMLKVFGKGLINSAEREEADAVFKTKGSEAAARVILAYVDRHLPNWDRLFTDILKQSYMSDIAELFEMIERQPSPVQKKPGTANIFSLSHIKTFTKK
jgi:hypothetical protein